MSPALWNGYPLLQYDTGGYLARWYEGYLVPSRSTTFGIYLHLGETSRFWINVALQSLAAAWVILLTLRALGLLETRLDTWRYGALMAVLSVGTALPWLVSLLLTDIFAGLSVLTLYLLVCRDDRLSRLERIGLFLLTAFAAASHSATLAVLLGLCLVGWMARPWLSDLIPVAGLLRGSLALVAGGLLLLATNYALSGKVAWTPGGYGVAFGRMLQDGIVKRYLDAHCPDPRFQLCPYRDKFPATADEFLWGKSMFDTLGRFTGLGVEMRTIVIESLAAYPQMQAQKADAATAQQLTMVATGEGTHNLVWHTYGIFDQRLPWQAAEMRAAKQQKGQLDFHLINRLHVPVALTSMLVVVLMLAHGIWRRQIDQITLLAAVVTLSLLGNAAACGVLSGPHDRYGARIVWIATFVVGAALLRLWSGRADPRAVSKAA